ncbi:hypothetical protein J14TS2_53040 [Bacillus sp. J14TS2]|uniref:cell wall-active antibiotics response protein LiaF n=1 Tax=Bacillus sp. J14TS2 TaxID=2807188 RepID=UPI001B08A533|nr:cell wall-active antibiotics response protein LiaF [Bacillus sp. J14TS2]GIN74829.1 hypothetical protein J14TS2_53040 [Bacillus sp. J14TS2]
MFKRLDTNYFNWILIIGAILLLIEIVFFHGGIIYAVISGCFVYMSWKKIQKLGWKVVFAISLVSFILAFFNLLVVRFFIIVAIVIIIYNYMKSKKAPQTIAPQFSDERKPKEALIHVQPLFDERLFDDLRTEDTAYQWKDVNIHGIYGDRVIDLSNTVLPNDTAVVSIRHLIGNIEIYVPYEVEVSIHHSSVFGRATILGAYHGQLMNKSIHYETANYNTTYPRVKIITSIFSGDIEVKRV